MFLTATTYVVLGVAAIPFIYYLLALYSSARFFSAGNWLRSRNANYFPPISCLKPIKGLDPDTYENYASFCRQDYPGEYEILFCVDRDDPALPILEQLVKDFPQRQIRLLYGSGRNAINDKVGRLVRLVAEAKHELVTITDGDIRVQPDYLRTVAATMQDEKVGGATCLYTSTEEANFVQEIQSVGMLSDFFAGVLVAWQLDGIKFMFGQSIITYRRLIAGFGGYERIENRPADDLWVGRLVAEQGYEVKLLPQVVQTVADFNSMKDLLLKRVRWMTVMRLMRPWGHLGLIFTWGLPWSLVAVAVMPTLPVMAGFLGTYVVLRLAMAWLIGIHGMKQKSLWARLWMIPVWDAIAFGIWLASFARNTIRWRGIDYLIRQGMLVPASEASQHAPR
jgi:ceramide glucosyltransferase